MLLNNTQNKEDISREIKNILNEMIIKYKLSKSVGCSENSVWREIYNIECIRKGKDRTSIT